MKKHGAYDKLVLVSVLLALCVGAAACSSSQKTVRDTRVIVEESPVIPDPGAVEFVWEPPMIDVVDVPPGLDPEGHYYRPAHQEVVEIRQGRWMHYKAPAGRP